MSEYDYEEYELSEDELQDNIRREESDYNDGEKSPQEENLVLSDMNESAQASDYQSTEGDELPPYEGTLEPISVDWAELEGALENNSPELNSFLNKITGDVIRIFRGNEDSENRLREIEEDNEYIYVEPISSREQYRWMEEYIEIVEESNLKDKLSIAIDGKGAFRRFKDVLVGYPSDRERWFAKRAVKIHAHIKEWLNAKGLEPINTPPWNNLLGNAKVNKDAVNTEREEEPNGSSGSTDLRQIAHGIIDLVPSRELPTAVAFLEFLRSRRHIRRNKFS